MAAENLNEKTPVPANPAPDSEKKNPGEEQLEKNLASTVLDFIGTRAELLGLEGGIAGKSALKLLVYGILALCFGMVALAFLSLALLIIFWDEHRVFISCSLFVLYLVLTLFFYGKIKAICDALPYSFEVSKQVFHEDAANLRAAFEGKQPPYTADPVEEMNQTYPNKQEKK